MFNEFNLRDFLVENANQSLSLFSQFVEGILLLSLYMNWFSSSSSRHVAHCLFDVCHWLCAFAKSSSLHFVNWSILQHTTIILLLHLLISLFQLFEVTCVISIVIVVQIIRAYTRCAWVIVDGAMGRDTRIMHRINQSWNYSRMNILSLSHRIRKGQGFNVLNAKVHVTGNCFEQIWLILDREILVCIATKNGKSVQSPVDLTRLSRFERQSHPLGLSLCLRELYFESVVILGLIV